MDNKIWTYQIAEIDNTILLDISTSTQWRFTSLNGYPGPVITWEERIPFCCLQIYKSLVQVCGVVCRLIERDMNWIMDMYERVDMLKKDNDTSLCAFDSQKYLKILILISSIKIIIHNMHLFTIK